MAKITPEISKTILRLTAEGQSAQKVCDYVKAKYDVELSRPGIFKHVKGMRQEREVVAKEIAAKYVEQSIPGDLEIMGQAIERLNKIALDPKLKPQQQINANVALIKAAESRLKISGVGTEDNEFKITWDMSGADDELEVIEEKNIIDIDVVDE